MASLALSTAGDLVQPYSNPSIVTARAAREVSYRYGWLSDHPATTRWDNHVVADFFAPCMGPYQWSSLPCYGISGR